MGMVKELKRNFNCDQVGTRKHLALYRCIHDTCVLLPTLHHFSLPIITPSCSSFETLYNIHANCSHIYMCTSYIIIIIFALPKRVQFI